MRVRIVIALMTAGILAGCASVPAVPYWENPQWINALGTTVHQNIQYPQNATKEDFPSGTAVVAFTYSNNRLQAPRILKSTRSLILDNAILQQIPSIKPPPAEGPNADTPHDFEIKVSLYPMTPLFRAIHHELQAHVDYPSKALLQGDSGIVIAEFKYRNGVVFDSKIESSSDSRQLDSAVLQELQSTHFPKPPDWLKDKTFSFRMPFCFSLGVSSCPRMEVRYVAANTSSAAPKAPCAKVGFRYDNGEISNVRLIASSGDAELDKRALTEAFQGALLTPPMRLYRANSDVTAAVCSSASAAASSKTNQS